MASLNSKSDVHFWHVNVPEAERTGECPEFLSNLSEKDMRIISTPDSDYCFQTWEEACDFVRTNRLDLFQRVPSDLRRYRRYIHLVIKEHGSVERFILQRRLHWEGPLAAAGDRPFEREEDIKILYNDWPYGVDPRIVHLVVWTKFRFEEDTATGDLTDQAREEIESFVSRRFRTRVPADQVIWFKNWSSLKSVHAVEHFHVMLLSPDPDFIREITSGDVPQCEKE